MSEARDTPRSADALGAIARAVEQRIGASAARTNVQALHVAVARASRACGATSPMELLARLEDGDPEVLEALVLGLTVGETYFFRDPEQIEVFRSRILPSALARHPERRLRVWSAGCATGEEPYTLAIACIEALGPSARQRVEILATDVSPAALRRAREGTYGDWSFRGVSSAVRAKWFEPVERLSRIRDQPRELVRFDTLNLLDGERWPRDVDVVFCRNVLIYFTSGHVARCMERFAGCLTDRGWLVLGPSDPPPATPALVALHTVSGIAYRRVDRGASAPETRDAPPQPPMVPVSASSVPPLASPTPVRLPRAADPRPMPRPATHEDPASVVESPEMLLARATNLSAAGDHARAARDAERVIALDPSIALAHLLLATTRAAGGDVTGARRAARHAHDLLAHAPDATRVPYGGDLTFEEARRRAVRVARLGARRRRPL